MTLLKFSLINLSTVCFTVSNGILPYLSPALNKKVAIFWVSKEQVTQIDNSIGHSYKIYISLEFPISERKLIGDKL